jgi:hypothetical protein
MSEGGGMRSAIACLALAGCVATTSRVTVPAVPAPTIIEVDGDCDEARKAYPNATHCDSESHATGATYALGLTILALFALFATLPHGFDP